MCSIQGVIGGWGVGAASGSWVAGCCRETFSTADDNIHCLFCFIHILSQMSYPGWHNNMIDGISRQKSSYHSGRQRVNEVCKKQVFEKVLIHTPFFPIL